jgi:hypothetical protein
MAHRIASCGLLRSPAVQSLLAKMLAAMRARRRGRLSMPGPVAEAAVDAAHSRCSISPSRNERRASKFYALGQRWQAGVLVVD